MDNTPGPWIFEPHGGFGGMDFDGEPFPFGYISTSAPMPIFAILPIVSYPVEELEANARLMAAAPEMLDALKEAVDILGVDLDVILGSHCALGSDGEPDISTLDEWAKPDVDRITAAINAANLAIEKAGEK